MGIGSILGTALRGVAWGQVANAALQYGPEIVKKIKERRQMQPQQPASVPDELVAGMQERIEELEASLLKQQDLIAQQTKAIGMLEDAARTLQARLRTATLIAAGLGVASLVLVILLLNK